MRSYLSTAPLRDLQSPIWFRSLTDLESNPLFYNIATAIKKPLNARQSVQELNQQNKESYLAFMDRLDNDIVFRLTVTKQYYLLSALFEDPTKTARWEAFLEEMEKEEEAYKRQVRDAWTEYAITRTQQLKAEQTALQSQAPAFKWTHPAPGASDMERLAHYEREYNRITYDYHMQRAELHQEDYFAHLNHLEEVLAHLRANEEENRELIRHIDVQRGRVEGMRQDAVRAGLNERPGDMRGAKKYDEHWHSLRQELKRIVQDSHNRPDAQSKEIQKIYNKNKDIFKQNDEKIKQVDTTYDKEIKHVLARIKAETQTIKARLNSDIEALLNQYSRAQEGLKLSESDQKILEQSIERIEGLKISLRETSGISELQVVEEAIIRETRIISQILTKGISAHQAEEQRAVERVREENALQGVEPSAVKLQT